MVYNNLIQFLICDNFDNLCGSKHKCSLCANATDIWGIKYEKYVLSLIFFLSIFSHIVRRTIACLPLCVYQEEKRKIFNDVVNSRYKHFALLTTMTFFVVSEEQNESHWKHYLYGISRSTFYIRAPYQNTCPCHLAIIYRVKRI